MNNEYIGMGILGTVISATGASLSLNEIQTIISIIVTVVGFIVSVIVPGTIKIFYKIKEARKDKKITQEEAEDINNSVKELIDDIKENLDNGND